MAALSALAPATSPQPRKLRVGVFADTRLQPQWVVESFARMAKCDFAEIVAVCCGDAAPPGLPWAWKLYDKVDRAAFHAGRDPLALADLTRLPHQKPLQAGSQADLLALDLDVAFALGRFDDQVLDGIAHYGVWRYCFGEQRHEEEALAGVDEVVRGLPVSGSGVKVRIGGSVRLAYQSWSRTYPFSVARNRAQLLRKTAEFAQRALAELHRSGRDWLEQCKLVAHPPAAARAAEPSLAPILGRIAQRALQKALRLEQWFLAYKVTSRGGQSGGARTIPPDLAGFTRLMPPKDRYWADPFVLEKGGRYFVFFEELMFRTGKAHISMLEIDAGGHASPAVKVLERDYHLSYPFVVEHDGSLYMIPETAQNGTIEAYRCVDFPHSWRLERILVSGVHCVDATFHHGAGRWWMFGNVAAAGSTLFDDELHVFHADRLLGEWQPHARNPVKSDTRSARPAGKLYWHNGALYRPAQICAPLYGSGLSINRVMRLTTQDYAERQVERILPAAKEGLLGLHTLNRAGDLTIVDAFTRRRRF